MDEAEILRLRGKKRELDPRKPFGFSHDIEPSPDGPMKASTVFLIGKECPFRCLMCDLWQYTLDQPTPQGAIVEQLEMALPEIEHRDCIKLYNAGNFFDAQAVSSFDRQRMLSFLRTFKTVVVENHPKLVGRSLLDFAEHLEGRLQVAMGLETADESILKTLNKQMTLDDFRDACRLLQQHEIGIRAFVIHQLPGVQPVVATQHSIQSVQFAFDCGVQYCSLIPLRSGNGAIDHLLAKGQAHLPKLSDFLITADQCLQIANKVSRFLLVDLWDLEVLSHCEVCFKSNCRAWDLANQEQVGPEKSICSYCGDSTFGKS